MADKSPPSTAEADSVAARNLLQRTGTPTPRKPSKRKSSTRTSSDRHVSPYDRRDRKRRRDSPQRRRDSSKRRRDSPQKRDSPYRRRDSSRRSHSRNSSRSRSDSPKSSRHYRSPKPSSSRYDATRTAEYVKDYKECKETYYFSKTDSRRHSYSQSQVVFVSRCKQTYSQRTLPSAAVPDEILSDSKMDESYEVVGAGEDVVKKLDELRNDPEKMDELNEVVGALTEVETPEPEERPESPPVNRINVEIKSTKKNTKDVHKEIDEDRDFLNLIRLGKIPKTKKTKTMPKPIMLDSTGAIKKETDDPEIEKQKQEEYERIRKALPKPIMNDTKMIKKEHSDFNEIIQIDDNDDSRPEKNISPNPRFVLPVIKITRQMKPHTDKVDSSMSEKLCGILRKILRLRIKLMLTEIIYYIPSSAITAIYRETFTMEEDSELVNSLKNDIVNRKFDDFEPSDDEYENNKSSKRKVSDDNANIIPYVAGKKRKTDCSAVIKKSPRDDDLLILRKNIDLTDLSDNEEGNVNLTATATKSSTDMPPEAAQIDCIEIKKEFTDIEQEIKKEFDLSEINIEDFNMQLKEEVNIANVTNEPEEQINTQQPTAIVVKTEPDAVISIVKTEAITNDPPVTEEAVADIERSQNVNKTIENIVKPDPDAAPKMTENTDQNKLDSFVLTQRSSKNTDEKISKKPKETNKPLSKTKHDSSKNSDTSKKHEDVAKKKKKRKEKKSNKSKSKEKDENGERTKKNTKSDAGTKQKTSESTNMQTDKENPEQQNILKDEKVEQAESVETIQDFVSLVTNVVVVD